MDVQKWYSTAMINNLVRSRRRARARFYLSKVSVREGMSILDVGCGIDGDSLESELPPDYQITGIDIQPPANVSITHPGFHYIERDAEDLSCFEDRQFDLAISVGMMEHICNRQKLENIAREMNRVARQLVIVVPWKYAWIEPHFKFPFFQLLPWWLQARITRSLNCNGLGQMASTSPSIFKRHFEDTYQWLTTNQWKAIFGCQKSYLSPTKECLVLVRGS